MCPDYSGMSGPGDMPYDERDVGSILRHASLLKGKTLRTLGIRGELDIDSYKGKGSFGQVLEEGFFHIENNSSPEPDFKEVGMELKTTPMKHSGGKKVSKERLVLNIINYMDAPEKGWRMFADKNSDLLIVFYLWEKDIEFLDYRILKTVRWRFPEDDLRIIREDWNIIEGMIKDGRADQLSERLTRYLAACTKGVGHDRDMREQPFSDVPAKQRALSLKSSYMNKVFNESEDIGNSIRRKEDVRGYQSVIEGIWSEKLTFDEHVLSIFEPFIGRDCKEIEGILGIDLGRSKQYYNLLALRMAGVVTKHIKEFVDADITMKIVRLKRNGVPKEDMSFPYFKYTDLAVQTWEESDLSEQMDKRFFFPVFQMTEVKDSDKSSVIFKGAFFWYMPFDDLMTVKEVWEDTARKIRSGVYDDFVKKSDGRISHVRPHARDRADTTPTPDGKDMIKKCFWLNSDYIAKVVKENLS
jgi:DNA mismatch repair protein MutH